MNRSTPDEPPLAVAPDAEEAALGGPDRRTLFITARTHLYAVTLAVRGAH